MPQTDRPSMPSGSAPNVAGTFSTAKLTASEAAIDMAAGNPGKTEFPASWDDEKIVDVLSMSRVDLIIRLFSRSGTIVGWHAGRETA